VGIHYVITDGREANVNEFAGIKPKDRPACLCPVCFEPVILKLGEKRTFHAAHKPGQFCPLTNPETIQHFNAKRHIAHELQNAKILLAYQYCNGYKDSNLDCKANPFEVVVAEEWDEVIVEGAVGNYKADVLIKKDDKPILVIEVFHSHRIEKEKAESLINQNIPWIEVDVSEILGIDAWTKDKPLIPKDRKYFYNSKNWFCSKCQKEINSKIESRSKEDQTKQNTVTEYEDKTKSKFRIYDIYYKSGSWYREIVLVRYFAINGKTSRVLIETNKEEQIKLFETEGYTEKETESMWISYVKDWENKYLFTGSIIDAPISWRNYDDYSLNSRAVRNLQIFPKRYRYSKSKGWFLRPFLKDATWDMYWDDQETYNRGLSQMLDNERHYLDKKYGTVTENDTELHKTRIGVCVYCGEETTDYWYYNGKTGEAKCNACKKKKREQGIEQSTNHARANSQNESNH
jgi:hypothetical protein